jgi:NTP pyrophosphatase (non-canonical NTP hydrolase)
MTKRTKRDEQAVKYAAELAERNIGVQISQFATHPDAVQLQELTDKVIAWAAERDILKYSTPAAQFLKTVEELGELASATAKADKAAIADAIGDVTVTLIIATKLAGLNMPHTTVSTQRLFSPVEAVLALTMDCMSVAATVKADMDSLKGLMQGLILQMTTDTLNNCAIVNELRLVDCLQLAYDTIKDRKGHLTPEGIFVKEEK